MTNAHTSQKQRRVGPNIVRAWLDTVINPLLRGLDSERTLLQRENWTWRFEQQGLLSLVPLRSFISFDALDNLQQFLDLGPIRGETARRLKDEMEKHDEQVRHLRNACQKLHMALRESDELRRPYDRMASEHKIPLRPGQTFDSLFGAYQRENHLDVLAEDIVNGTRSVPSYFSTAPLWQVYGDELLKIRNTPGIRSRWLELKRASRTLASTIDYLVTVLRRTREHLSLKYDLPLVEARSM